MDGKEERGEKEKEIEAVCTEEREKSHNAFGHTHTQKKYQYTNSKEYVFKVGPYLLDHALPHLPSPSEKILQDDSHGVP